MLGVLKRRLKPKRATNEKENQNGRKYVHGKAEPIVPVDVARLAPSQRQIHPLFEEKVQVLAYDDGGGDKDGDKKTSPKKCGPTPSLKRCPDLSLPGPLIQKPRKSPQQQPRRPSATLFRSSASSKGSQSTFHPAPNICVEGGRIEFIKSPSEGSNLASLNPQTRGCFDKRTKEEGTKVSSGNSEQQFLHAFPTKSNESKETRAQQTQADFNEFEITEEKCDVAKEYLETRIKELQRLLESEQKSLQRERLTISRLQRQLARREAIQRDVDRERQLRTDTESRLRDTVSESERYRATLAGLQREFSKMEDSVRTMLQYKSRCELLNQEKVFLTAAYESRIHQYQNTVTKLGQENETLKQQVRLLEEATGTEELPDALLDRLRLLETENAHLSRDADFQRKQYERCLDDIANQVVRALLSQKGLREEIGNLQRRIKELENQNQALANILVNKGTGAFALPPADNQAQLVDPGRALWFPGNFTANDASLSIDTAATTTKESSLASSPSPSFVANEERKRLRRMYSSDLGDLRERNLFRSLNSVDSLVVVPLQRPKSLNLQQTSPNVLTGVSSTITGKRSQHKKYNSVTSSKKPGDDEGNESPESGNRDEGYSTMSSDIQGPGETSDLSKRELEDLKEASDETDVIPDVGNDLKSIVVVEDSSDPDMFFIPLNISLSINPRHSYPPHKGFLPFQQAVRSLSDSHLYLKVTAASPSMSSPLSPSVFFVDIIDKNHPLRRTKATSSLLAKKNEDKDSDDESHAGSWGNGVVDGCWWDAEYVQHWLKLDDNRLKEQQQKEILEIEYDRTEIEEWTMSLSCEDITKSGETSTADVLPSINENDSAAKTEEDGHRWNNFNCVDITIQSKPKGEESTWSYEANDTEDKFAWQETSAGGSWSSQSTNESDKSCHSLNDNYFNDSNADIESKRSSASGDVEVSSTVGTDFTRDFYRLVKFESTKSLTSNSSRSNGKHDLSSFNRKSSEYAQEREMALQSVLSFIVEQQKYCHNREEEDGDFQQYNRPHSTEPESGNLNCCDSTKGKEIDELTKKEVNDSRSENGVTIETLPPPPKTNIRKKVEITINLSRDNQDSSSSSTSSLTNRNVTGRKTVSKYGKHNQKSFEKESGTKLPVRNNKLWTSTPIPISRSDKVLKMDSYQRSSEVKRARPRSEYYNNQKKKSSCEGRVNGSNREERLNGSVSGDKTEVIAGRQQSRLSSKLSSLSKNIPAKSRETRIPISVSDKSDVTSPTSSTGTYRRLPKLKNNSRAKGTKIPVISTRKSESALVTKAKGLDSSPTKLNAQKTTMVGERKFDLRKAAAPETSATRQLFADEASFHQKATTKDVIDELNRMICKGEDVSPNSNVVEGELRPLDVACCCPTGWVHVERDIDFADPKARANLLDVMLASSGSSESSDTSSESGGDEPVDYTHLHRLHRFRRQRKAREQLGVLRYPLSSGTRPSIIGRENFFVRYGDKEKEAVASFDFLEEISTTSVSGCSTCDSIGSNHSLCLKSALTSPTDQDLPLSELDIATPLTPTTPGTPSDDSEERTGGPVSLSDSCADSYSESGGSIEDPCPNADSLTGENDK